MTNIPRRVPGGYFKPHEETVWPSPDGDEDLAVPPYLLRSAWAAYCNLLTHPCGETMLRSARQGWRRLNGAT